MRVLYFPLCCEGIYSGVGERDELAWQPEEGSGPLGDSALVTSMVLA